MLRAQYKEFTAAATIARWRLRAAGYLSRLLDSQLACDREASRSRVKNHIELFPAKINRRSVARHLPGGREGGQSFGHQMTCQPSNRSLRPAFSRKGSHALARDEIKRHCSQGQ